MIRFSFKPVSPPQAIALQLSLRDRVVVCPLNLSTIRYVGGADISYEILENNLNGFPVRRNSETVFAGIVVLKLPELAVVDQVVIRRRVNFPYIPGLLSFRETPAVLEAWKRLRRRPEVLLVDGHGLAHPRRFGIACHLGLLLDLSTVGCGKSLLVGKFDEKRLKARRGSVVPLRDGKERIGSVLRTRDGINPIIVSVGHRVDLFSAQRLVLRCSPRFRLPEPTRLAHQLVNAARRGEITLN